jgi:diaminohydroxyphosphoribosylaminopyrimidine deaminase/5-amino-6-(5-phosphoribosylamino)uracil reductase
MHRDRDTAWMELALRLAARGEGSTSPNPMVGAVIVSRNRIVGQGYHRRVGGPHAEQFALHAAARRARGATLYVTLEPCHHLSKRTPPCVPSIIAAGLRRVVVAMRDPNPLVSGRGIHRLRQAGLRVDVGCLQSKAERLNERYIHWVRTGRPFVILKAAMTLDGQIATATGESRWITSLTARRHVHRLRSRMDAVLVGVGTVLRDDPQLTVRLDSKQASGRASHRPLRVILDSRLRIPFSARVLRSSGTGRNPVGTVVMTTTRAPKRRVDRLRSRRVSVLVVPARSGRVSLGACLDQLGQLGITGLLIEGGGEVNACALREGLVNRVMLYVAPSLLGGQDAKGIMGGRAPGRLEDAIRLTDLRIRRVGTDYLAEGTPRSRPNRGRHG